ncbi:MAG: hypothetical protein P8Y45_18175, partial [Exilibacterium sp.]
SAANAWSGWTEQRCQGQKGACSVHLNLKRFGYIIIHISITDPLGRLDKISGPSTTTRLRNGHGNNYDGDEHVAEYNGTGTSPAHRYVYGDPVDDHF